MDFFSRIECAGSVRCMKSGRQSHEPTARIVFCPAWISILTLFVTGCATQPLAVRTLTEPQPIVTAAVLPTKFVETRFDVRCYREAANPAFRHEAHAVYRRTMVPITASDELATVPRVTYPPASFTPLPASAELAAELATQRTITGDLRAIQTSMVETERQVQAQYATLVRESAEALKVREQLEAERARMRVAPPAGAAVPPAVVPAGNPPEVRW